MKKKEIKSVSFFFTFKNYKIGASMVMHTGISLMRVQENLAN